MAPGGRGRAGKYSKPTRGGGKKFSKNLTPLGTDITQKSPWTLLEAYIDGLQTPMAIPSACGPIPATRKRHLPLKKKKSQHPKKNPPPTKTLHKT
ncbi:MAG: hypothetical protein Q9184_006555 [Pyrenodesmia sp. 2 TL-2023]